MKTIYTIYLKNEFDQTNGHKTVSTISVTFDTQLSLVNLLRSDQKLIL